MNPFREIWFNTGKCIDYCLANRKPWYVELFWIAGLDLGIRSLLQTDSELRYLLLFLSTIIGVVSLRFFLPWLLSKVGTLVNGQGAVEDLRLVVALQCIPCVLDLAYMGLGILIPGHHSLDQPWIYYLIWIVRARVLIMGVAKVQKVSYGFAVMNIFIPWVVLFVAYVMVRY